MESKLTLDNLSVRKRKTNDLIFTIEGVQKGSHTFTVEHPNNVTKCETVTFNITKPEEFRYECNYNVIK